MHLGSGEQTDRDMSFRQTKTGKNQKPANALPAMVLHTSDALLRLEADVRKELGVGN